MIVIHRDFQPVSRSVSETMQDRAIAIRHSYNERRIGTRMRFVTWCRFNRP